MVGAFRLESVKMRTQIVSILNKPEQYALGQELVAEYVEATAEEMAADPATFIPYIEGYSDFPGTCRGDHRSCHRSRGRMRGDQAAGRRCL